MRTMTARTVKAVAWFRVLPCGVGLLPLAVCAQSVYHDPHGRFEVGVQAGWSAAPDEGVDEFIIRRGATQAIVLVSQQSPSKPMTGEHFVGEAVEEFKQQCPTFRARQRGTVGLAGEQAVYQLVTCDDEKSPAVAETAAALRRDNVLIAFTMIAPLAHYVADLPTVDGIRDSLRVPGGTDAHASPERPDADSLEVREAKRECAVDIFSAQDCSRRIGMAYSRQTAADDATDFGKANVYHDPTGRFSFRIPSGWTAISEGEKGLRGVQLRAGENWINVMPAGEATSASEVVLRYEQEMATHSQSDRKPPFGKMGLLQVFGHGVELTYDNFSANGADGTQRDSYVGGVGSVSGAGSRHLLMVGSINPQSDGGVAFLTVGQSVHFGSP